MWQLRQSKVFLSSLVLYERFNTLLWSQKPPNTTQVALLEKIRLRRKRYTGITHMWVLCTITFLVQYRHADEYNFVKSGGKALYTEFRSSQQLNMSLCQRWEAKVYEGARSPLSNTISIHWVTGIVGTVSKALMNKHGPKNQIVSSNKAWRTHFKALDG